MSASLNLYSYNLIHNRLFCCDHMLLCWHDLCDVILTICNISVHCRRQAVESASAKSVESDTVRISILELYRFPDRKHSSLYIFGRSRLGLNRHSSAIFIKTYLHDLGLYIGKMLTNREVVNLKKWIFCDFSMR